MQYTENTSFACVCKGAQALMVSFKQDSFFIQLHDTCIHVSKVVENPLSERYHTEDV